MAGQFGLTVSLPKAKDMAIKAGTGDAAVSLLRVEGGTIEMVNNFTYLGSCLSTDGELKVTDEVACRIVGASKAFGSLCAHLRYSYF